MGRIEEPPVGRDGPRARAAVKEDHGRSLGVARDLPIEGVQRVDGKPSAVVRFDGRKELLTRHLRFPRLDRLLGCVGRVPGPAAGAAFYRRSAAWQIAALVLCCSGPAAAETLRRGVVDSVIDGDTVVLQGGAEVRLVGIQAPKLALGRPGLRDWPLATEAKELL